MCDRDVRIVIDPHRWSLKLLQQGMKDWNNIDKMYRFRKRNPTLSEWYREQDKGTYI